MSVLSQAIARFNCSDADKLVPRVKERKNHMFYLKYQHMLWVVWLSGLSADLQTERSPVRFPVRTHAWVAGQVPSWEYVRVNRWMHLSHTDVPLPLLLLPFPPL